MKVISFNSYKGGACRTTTCYNTLPYLALKLGATSHQPLIVFDVDLDSMGLTSLLLDYVAPGDPRPYSARHLFVSDNNDVVNDIDSVPFGSIDDGMEWLFDKHFIKIGKDLGLPDDGSVLFLPADTNADTISDDQFNAQSNNPPIKTLIKKLKFMHAEDQPKALIFDCASGIQQTTLTVLSIIDKAVVCMRPSTQFRIGTRDYLVNKIPKKLANLGSKKREIVLLPTAVPSIYVSEDEPNYKQIKKKLVDLRSEACMLIDVDIVNEVKADADKDNNILGYKLNIDMMYNGEGELVGIPDAERLKWQENDLIYKLDDAELSSQECTLRERYEKLAEIIVEEKQ